jgi:hypothetical protein
VTFSAARINRIFFIGRFQQNGTSMKKTLVSTNPISSSNRNQGRTRYESPCEAKIRKGEITLFQKLFLRNFWRLSASLGAPFYQDIPIFIMKNDLISLGKMEIPWKNRVLKLALSEKLDHFPSILRIESETNLSFKTNSKTKNSLLVIVWKLSYSTGYQECCKII